MKLTQILGVEEMPDLTAGQLMEGTCEWIEETDEYKTWTQPSCEKLNVLWLTGLPGTGKSSLSRHIIHTLCPEDEDLSSNCQFHFFTFTNAKARKTTYALRHIAFQLASGNTMFRKTLLGLHEKTGFKLHQQDANGIKLLETTNTQNFFLAQRILTWATCSTEPLTTSALSVALQPDFKKLQNLEATILHLCGHFLSTTGSKITLIHETIAAVAKKYSKTPAQVILCQLLLRGVSIIPKSNNPARIEENFDCIFDMAEEDFVLIDNLMGEQGEKGVRNLETLDYVGFDNYNEEVEEP